MRYTTIIDVTEVPAVWRNPNCRTAYLYLALKCGYHDTDRDMIVMSYRRLAAECGITEAAARHALNVLTTVGLLARNGNIWTVRKWIEQEPITTRPKTKRQQQQLEAAAIRQQESEARQRERDIQDIQRRAQFAEGKTSFMLYFEELQQRAAAGDQEAAAQVKRHRAMYEQHKAQFNNNNQSKSNERKETA